MLDPQHHPIDDLFAEGLKDAKAKAPASVWEGISSALETQRLRRKVVFLQWTAAASIALLLGFGAWYLFIGQHRATVPAQFAQRPPHADPVRVAQAPHEQECLPTPQVAPQVTPQAPAMHAQASQPAQAPYSPAPARQRAPKSGFAAVATRPVSLASYSLATAPERPLPPAPSLEAPAPREPLFVPAPLTVNEDFFAEFQPRREEQREAPARRFSLGGSAAPDFAFASQTPVALAKVNRSSKTVLPDDPTDSRRSFTPVMAFTTGMNMNYDLSNRLSVGTGMYYTRRSSDRGHAITKFGEVEAVQTNFEVSFVEVPATVRYDVIEKEKWDTYVSTGVSANLFLQYNNSFESESGTNARRISDKSEAFTPSQANVLLSAGMNLKLHERVELNVEPRMRYGIFANEYAFVSSNPLSLAGITGLNYRF